MRRLENNGAVHQHVGKGRATRSKIALGACALALVGACTFVDLGRYIRSTEYPGSYVGSVMAVSHSDPKVIAIGTSSGSTQQVACWDPKTDSLNARRATPAGETVFEVADDPSSPRTFAGARMWAVLGTFDPTSLPSYTFEAVPFDYNCNFVTGDAVALPPITPGRQNQIVLDYDIDPVGDHFALLYEQLSGSPALFRLARYDESAGTWSTSTIATPPTSWTTLAGSNKRIALSVDAFASPKAVVVGAKDQVTFNASTLAQTSTRTLAVPSGYQVADSVVRNGSTIAILDATGGGLDRVSLFQSSGALDTTGAQRDFMYATRLAAPHDTSDAGGSCGPILKFEVLGPRPYAADPENHLFHQFWASAASDCDPSAYGDPGF